MRDPPPSGSACIPTPAQRPAPPLRKLQHAPWRTSLPWQHSSMRLAPVRRVLSWFTSAARAGDCAAAVERFAVRFERMSPAARRRIAIEPDGERFGLFAALRLHRFTGIPVVFDAFHFQLRNPERIGLSEALGLALATWSPGVRPEVHFSTQRTEAHLRRAGQGAPQVVAPRAGQHSDFVNPFEFIAFLDAARGLPPFDVMLEAKAADLALLRLRDDLRRYAPEYVGWVV
jgi:UV DNA damage endonuclease